MRIYDKIAVLFSKILRIYEISSSPRVLVIVRGGRSHFRDLSVLFDIYVYKKLRENISKKLFLEIKNPFKSKHSSDFLGWCIRPFEEVVEGVCEGANPAFGGGYSSFFHAYSQLL